MHFSTYRDDLAYVGALGTLAFIYYVTASFGLSLAYIHPSITTVWAPTGLSLVALLLFGYRYFPGIFLGAFAANLMIDGAVFASVGIAMGNTLEALVGTYLIKRFAGGIHAFNRAANLVAFIACVSIASMVGATIGVSILTLGNLAAFAQFYQLWLTWWLGDLGGALLVTPFVLTWWMNYRIEWRTTRLFEALAIIASIFAVAYIVFGPINFSLAFCVVPILLWVAMRFTIREVSSGILLLAALSVGGTIHGFGPYSSPSLEQGFLYLQAYIIIMALSSLIMSAVVSERREAQVALEGADRAKDNFLTALSHELRNPLASIVSHVQLMGFEKHTKTTSHLLHNVRLELHQTTKILEDLLDLSRIRRGRMALNKEYLNVSALTNEVTDNFMPIARESGHTVEKHIDDRPLWIYGDPTRVKQILTNLLSNACKYTEPGGLIRVVCHASTKKVALSVQDSGAGIEPEHLSTLIAGSDSGRVQHPRAGLGVGLMLVRRLVDLHNATLSAHSDGKGMGSRFTVTFPLIRDEEVPESARTEHASLFQKKIGSTSERRSILVVDDNVKAADALVLLLEKMGHHARAVYDGASALSYVAKNPVEMVLLDIGLPDISGYELARKLRELPPEETPILIAISGYGTEGDVERSREIGIARHLVKPIDVKELEALLK